MTEILLSSIATLAGLFLFAGSLAAIILGRKLGREWLGERPDQLAQLDAVDTGVFALLGLLLAFSLAGAIDRFDKRREAIVREATAVSKAYRSFDLLPQQQRGEAQDKLRTYVEARIALFEMARSADWKTMSVAYEPEQLQRIHELETSLWKNVVASCQTTTTEAACSTVLPAVGDAFEIAKMRSGTTEIHPPLLLTAMLITFSIVGSLLAGFRMYGTISTLHAVIFAVAMAATLFMTLEIEYPRLGYIRIDDFDRFLVHALDQMKSN